MLAPETLSKGAPAMTPYRKLLFNASSTAACAIGMLAARGSLSPLFGLHTPALLDVLAVGLLALRARSWSRPDGMRPIG